MTLRSTTHTMGALLGLVWSGTAGCSPTVVLGSECPGQVGECEEATAPFTERPASPEEDAAQPEAGPPDAEVVPDADVEPAEIVPLALLNPDFERNGGLGGDVVLSNLIGGLVPIPPVTLVFAQLPNWYACWFLSVNSVSWELDDAGVPQRVGDYLSFAINNVAVRQELPTSMRAGTTYAFEMDVVSQPDNGAELYVAFRGADALCGDGTLLGRSALLPAHGGWSTTCVEFTADSDYSHLLLVPGSEGAAPSGSARLLLDTLRQVSSCAPAE